MLAYLRNSTDNVAFAFLNSGGVRATIGDGDIIRGQVLTSFPYGNAVVGLTLSGSRLWDTLQGIVAGVNVDNGREVTSFLQVSEGIKVEYSPGDGGNAKLLNVTIRGKPLDRDAQYKIAAVDYVAQGGDNIFSPPFEGSDSLDTLADVLAAYIQVESPIDIKLDSRIVASNGTSPDSGNGDAGGSNSTENGATLMKASNLIISVAMAMIIGV